MNRKTTLALVFAACASTITAHAESVTSDEALARVVAQLNGHASAAHRVPVSASAFTAVPSASLHDQGAPAYYVFNRASGGFVIAPANDAQPAILALIDAGSYDETCLPDGFKAWLAEVTTYGAAEPVLSPVEGASAQRVASAVSPLLAADQISWTQTTPYNTECPKFTYQNYPYDTLAGCAAIAAGQIMRYHKWPAQGYGSVNYESYVSVSGEEIVTNVERDFSEHAYDWTKIRGNYQFSGTGTIDERAEVAKFVADVACASFMNFDPQASATYDYRVAQALKKNFDYDASLQLIDHANYSTAEWADVLRAELDEGRPVYLSGANISTVSGRQYTSGHAFVCDGYNADGLFHINWGWGGTSDGYFALTSLNPKQQGAGGSAGGYSFMANAIIGIQPNQGGEEAKAILTLDNEYWETSYDSANDGYAIHANIANLTATDFEGFVAMRFMEGDNVLLGAKQNAKVLRALAGTGGQYSLGLDRQSLIEHPTVRMELVYAHVPGVLGAPDDVKTALLESVGDDEWISISSREGAPKSLQAYKDSKDQFTFGSVPEEVYQLRLAGLQTDVTPKAGARVKFTATVTNLSDYEYFAPLYLTYYDRTGARIDDYSEYDLHLLPAHSTKNFDFTVTIPTGAASYAVLYEDLGYFWSYVPMQIYESDAYSVTEPFAPVLEPDPDEGGTDQPGTEPEESGYKPADGALAYYVKNVDSGYYLNVVEDERNCAILSDQKEVLYFEPTAKTNEYIIKGHTGLYLGGHEDNTWNMSSACPETWIVETQADGSVAFHAKSNASAPNGYIGFDVSPFDYYALGAKAKRNQRTSAHGLFTLEAADEEPGIDPEQPNIAVTQITLTVDGTTPDVATLTVGETLTVSAAVTPDNATDKSITWTTSDTQVATVEDGTVTAVGAGSVVITATAADGSNVSATLRLVVNDVVTPDPDAPSADATIAAKGDPVVIDSSQFPMASVPYYVRNVDSGCYLNIEESTNKCAVLRNAPEPLFFTASGTGFVIKDADNLYLGGHTNAWNMASNVSQVWTLQKVEDGVYALKCDKGYVGFDDTDGNRGNIKFADGADGFAAFRNKDYSANHGLFTIERANIYGDVDENRSVNRDDVDALVSILLRKQDVTPEADTDLDRFITISDVTTLIKYLNNK